MEFNSPKSECSELNTKGFEVPNNLLLSTTKSKYPRRGGKVINDCNTTTSGAALIDSNIDALLEEPLIPSPPLSPRLSFSKDRNSPLFEYEYDSMEKALQDVDEDNDNNKLILLAPSWLPTQTKINNRRDTMRFLSQYKMFDSLTLPNRRATTYTPKYYYRRQHNRSTSSEQEIHSSYNLRTSPIKAHSHERDEIYTNKRRIVKPHRHNVKVVRRSKNTSSRSPTSHLSHSSPNQTLASAAIISKIPQYVPNVSWSQIPDYSPPIDTIPWDNNKCLRVEWRGSPMDLSNDPFVDKLHPAEVQLAQILRLPCDLYLDSKRRLFLEKVYRLKLGLPFRRTDAQKACRIDVNKASRLFAAFEKVGWLKDNNFQKYL